MARADLLVDLIKYAIAGNKPMIRKIAEAVIVEERNKQHTILANKLESELNKTQNDFTTNVLGNIPKGQVEANAESLLNEISPQKKITDLVLPKDIISICEQFIQEQYRVDLLRSYGLEPRNRILLVGSPGNGKTSLAEAIAESLMVPMYVVKYENIIGAYLGETALQIKKNDRLCKYTKMCVISG